VHYMQLILEMAAGPCKYLTTLLGKPRHLLG
jgi:hypothetical protein